MRHIIYGIMGFSILSNITAACLQAVFTLVLSLLVQSQKYFTASFFTFGALNLLTDFLIWSLPLPTMLLVMDNLSARKKILVGLVFAVGVVSWCSSILRISWRKYIVGLGADPTYNAPILIVLYVTEISLAICCVSVVTLRPLVVKITKGFNRLRGKPTSTNKSRTTGYGFGTGPSRSQPKGYESRPGTSHKGGFEEHITIGQELVEWKKDDCPCKGFDVELGGIVAHTSLCPRHPDLSRGTRLQIPAPAAIPGTIYNTTHRSSGSSSTETLRITNIGSACRGAHLLPPCDALPSSESIVDLTNTNTNPTTHYPRPLV